MSDAHTILRFWFQEIDSALWWRKDAAFDALIGERFGALHRQASQGELAHWRTDAQGRLAEIIVLDQFSRNLYRDSALAFSQDLAALCLAQEAIRLGLDHTLNANEKAFLYLPFMHSESLAIHEQAVQLYQAAGLEYNLAFEYKHKIIIERFGRYPHRNQVLGRLSSPEELAFLQQPDSHF
ncbi:DUF924 family protein [Agitococcus lubricus]|uniref:Uncharacterized protein (DUF924 family) n=1 Tax=Agitococcus lubricus TaxID=1077255 RepID=A0A2T5J3B0_9GAMM|nr:DUF924 family protein [Agitococcus lubricus]PTQ91109.1 uncharacterized protein (DUF924 family) [Agitococcus lubricus]